MPAGGNKVEVTDQALLDQLNSEDDNSSSDKSIADMVDESLAKRLPVDKRGLVMAQLRHETGKSDLDSNVAIKNNNVSGITWNKNFPEEWRGTRRPASEGGYYVHFPTVDDWADEHVKLLKKNKGAGAPLDASSIEDYAHRLKANGYYTAPESEYVNGMKRMHEQYGEDAEEVTDPALLSQLNGDESSPVEKKSPVVSEVGLADNSQPSQIDLSATTATNQSAPTPAPSPVTEQGVVNKIFGNDLYGNPVVSTTPQPEPAQIHEDPKAKTANALNVLGADVVNSAHDFSTPEYAKNLSTIPFDQPGSIVHDITNPHGDPKVTGDYAKYRIQQLKIDKQTAMNKLSQESRPGDPGYEEDLNAINSKFDSQINQFQNAAAHTTSLQLANREVNQKKYTPAQAEDKIKELTEDHKAELAKMENPGEKAVANLNFQQKKQEIRQNEKYDAVQLGLEQQILLGNKTAEDDLAKYKSGLPINEDRKVAYQEAGLHTMQLGAVNADANDQKDVAKELAEHSDDIEGRLIKDNPKYFRKQWGNELGSYIYNNVDNPAYRTLFTRPQLTEEEIKKYGKQAGLSKEQVSMLKPEDVPTSSSVYAQFGQSAINSFTFQNENSKYGHLLTGSMPQEQHSLNNIRGVLGEVAGGAGTVAGFIGQSMIGGEALKGAELLGDVGLNAKRYEQASNMIPLAISNYNNSYDASKTVIGDKPEDEMKRQAYSLINATIGTALMSIDPATVIGKDALGMTVAGKDVINTIKRQGLENITRDEFKDNIQKVLQQSIEATKETGKHVLSQAAIMSTNKAAENVTDMIFDPEHRHGIMDNTGDAGLQAGVSMFLPSLFAGIQKGRSQTPANKALLYGIGTNPKQYRDQVSDLYKQGKLTKDEAIQSYDNITSAASIINTQIPRESVVNNKELTVDQKQDYAYNLLQEKELTKQMDALPEDEKTQRSILSKKIKDLDTQRQEILTNAGEAPGYEKPVLPAPEDSEPKSNGANATEAQSGDQTLPPKKVNETQKKYEERIKEFKENNIPLSSQEDKTPKTTDHGKNNDVQRNEQASSEISETKDQRQDAEVQGSGHEGVQREAVNVEGNVQVKPEVKEATAEATPKEEPLPVSAKQRRKKFVVDEEPAKPQENASTQSEEQQQEGAKQGGEPTSVEQPKSEKERSKILINELLDTDGDVDKSFGKAGYVNVDGLWVHPDAVEYYNKLSDKTKEALKKNGIKYFSGGDGYHGAEAGSANSISHDGTAIHGVHVRTDVGEHFSGHDHVVIHEAGHAVWDSLSDAEKKLFHNDNPLSAYAKEVKKSHEAGKPISGASHGEEDFAELFAKNGGDLKATLKEASENENNKPNTEPAPARSVAPEAQSDKRNSVTKKSKTDASIQSKEQQPEGNKQSGKPEHARAEQARSEKPPAEAKNSNSDIGGEKKEVRAEESVMPAKETSPKTPKSFSERRAQIEKDRQSELNPEAPKLLTHRADLKNERRQGLNEILSGLRQKEEEAEKTEYIEDPALEKAKKDEWASVKANEGATDVDNVYISSSGITGHSSGDVQNKISHKFNKLRKEKIKPPADPKLKEDIRTLSKYIADRVAADVSKDEINEKHDKRLSDLKKEEDTHAKTNPNTEPAPARSVAPSAKSTTKTPPPKKLTYGAEKIANKQIGEYNAVHGKTWAKQNSIMEGARRRVEAFEKIDKKSDKYKKGLDQYEADKATLKHIEEKPPKRSRKNQSKVGDDVTARIKQREEVLNEKPATIEEWAKQELLGMDDNRPENKFATSSVEKDLATRKGSEERTYTSQFLHKDGKNIDAWAADIARDPKRWPEGMDLSDEQAIKEAITPLLTEYENKETLQKDLAKTFEDRKAQEEYWADRTEHHEFSDEFVPESPADIKSWLSGEEIQKPHDAIDIANMSDKEADILDGYLATITDENGKIDLSKIDPFSDEYQKAFDALGKEGRDLLDLLYHPEHSDTILETIKNKTNGKHTAESSNGEIKENAAEGQGESIASRSGDEPTDRAGQGETKEKLNSEPQPNGAIATEATLEDKASATKNRLKEIDEDIIRQTASAKMYWGEGVKAEKNKNTAEAERQRKNWQKKQERIEALKKERDDLNREAREESIKATYNKTADKIVARYEKNKRAHEGVAYSSVLGLTHKVADHVADYLVEKVADGIRELGNIHVAIDRAIRQAKEKFGEEAKPLSYDDIQTIKDNIDFAPEPQKAEPVLSTDQEEYAKDLMADINAGKMSYDEALKEVSDLTFENRQGEPLSDNVADKHKAKILNYIDWYNKDRYIHNADLAEPKEKNNVISEFGLTNGDQISHFLSGKTIELRTGDKPLNEQQVIKYQLELAAQDSQAMVSKMKHHFGIDVVKWGTEMLKQINDLPGGDTVKRVTALIGLMDELRKDRGIYEYELSQNTDPARRQELNRYLAEIPQITKRAEKVYQDTQREASKTINTGRIMAKLFAGKFAHEMHADEAVLTPDQREAKTKFEDRESEAKVTDKAAKEGAIRTEKEADAAIEELQKKKPEPKPAGKEKGSNLVKKVKELVTNKKGKEKSAMDKMKKEAADKMARKGMTPENMYEKVKELLKKTKC